MLFPQLPEGTSATIQANLDIAREKVASTVDNLDSLACEGLDQLTAKLPALKEATPELFETVKDTTVTYAEYAKEYVASFSLAQIALKLGDKGLQVATDALQLTGLEESKPLKPVLTGIKTIRRSARAVRRAGAKAAGMEPAKTIGEASLLGAVAEIVGLNFFLSVVGLQLVPANMQSNAKTTALDTTYEEETVGDKLSNDRIARYVSDEDPDFIPSDVSADSAQEDSEGEEAIVEVVEEVKEEIENVVDENVKEIEDDIEEVVNDIEEVVEEVADTVEDVVEKIADKIEEIVVEAKDDVEEANEADEELD